MAKTTPRVNCNRLNTASRLMTDRVIDVGSKAWFDWVEVPENRAFMFEPTASSTQSEMWNYSAQKEERRDDFYWYAYKRYKGKLYRHYLGQGKELNHEKLLQASKELVNKYHNPPEAVPHRVKQSSTNRIENSSTTHSLVPQHDEELSPSSTGGSSTTITIVPHHVWKSSPNSTEDSSITNVELLTPGILELEALRAENERLRVDTDFWRCHAIWNRADMLNRQQLRDLKAEVAGLRAQLHASASLVVELRAERRVALTDTLGTEQQNLDINALVTIPPAKPIAPLFLDLEAIGAVPDIPLEMEAHLEETKVLSDDDVSLTSDQEEVEEGHASALPSTGLETATTSPMEAIHTIVSQPASDATEQSQPESENGKTKSPLRDRIMEVLKKHQEKATVDEVMSLLGLPNDKKTKKSVTDALGRMVKDVLLSCCKSSEDKRIKLYWVPSTAEIEALLKHLTLKEQLH